MPLFPAPAPAIAPDYLAPTGFSYSTFARNLYSNVNLTPSTGTLYLVAVALPAGFRVGKIAYHSGTTGATTPTNWWYSLYDSSRVLLATTANQTTAAFAGSSLKSLNIATTAAGASTSYTTTYSGLHYLGFLMTASTMPTLTASVMSAGMASTAPLLNGLSNTGLTTPSAFPTTAAALTFNANPPYATVGL